MDSIATLRVEFDRVMQDFQQARASRMLAEGRLTVAHYKAILREIFHYSREDPQIQALAAVRFRGPDRDYVKPFFKHATMEIGHDRLALEDLAALGEDVAGIPASNPLPTTLALISFPFYQIEHLDPVGYLGYLYFLEFLPTRQGRAYAESLARAGVPPTAMSFLAEHASVDVAHNKMMEHYLRGLVHSRSDLDAVVYALKVTGRLYAGMLEGAIDHAERGADYGRSGPEARVAAAGAAPVGAVVA